MVQIEVTYAQSTSIWTMKQASPSDEALLAFLGARGIARACDLRDSGHASSTLARLVHRGRVARLARGLYALPEFEPDALHGLALVAARVEGAVACLATALQIHDLSTWITPEVWIAVLQHRRAPVIDYPPLKVVWVAPHLFELGVETMQIEGIAARVTGPARTVVDCFRWRNQIGIDVAVEALRSFTQKYRGQMPELHRIADACRMTKVMRPYLEALQ